MKIGYARVSTAEQSLDCQLTALKDAGCSRIYQEKITGVKTDRPELARLLDHLRPNDTVVVYKLDRLARSTAHLFELVEHLRLAEVSLCSLSEPWLDATSQVGKLMMTIFAGIAEFERDLIRERTSQGRKEAKQRGVRFGRPEKMNNTQKLLAQRLLQEGKSVRDVAKIFNVHKATIYRL